MRVFIGVAWPYASGPRHLGHLAGAYLPADIVARYHRLAGDEVLMVSGSDCHGTPVTVAAERADPPIEAFVARQHEAIARSFERIGIAFDRYTTTTTANHTRWVHELFRRLHTAGYISEGTQESAWCDREARSLPDRYVEGTCPACGARDARGDQCDTCGRILDPNELGDPLCRRCGGAARLRELRQLFLRLDLLQSRIERYVRARAGWRAFVREETHGWFRAGLWPRAITRDLDWGVRVPLAGWDERRLYVFFEALVGYVSGSVEWAQAEGDPDGWQRWWHDPDAVHRYFIGKDNIPFHTIWWPAILIGAGEIDPASGLHLPDEVCANHYLTLGGTQMSASRGHGFTIDAACDRIGVDPLRHAICALTPEHQDVAFTWEQADDLTRTGLLGDIANPVHRVATLLWRRFGGRCDERCWTGAATADRRAAEDALVGVGRAFGAVELREALRRIHALGQTVNRRLAAEEPWHRPDPEAHASLTRLLPYLDALGVACWPVVPRTAERIRATLSRPRRPGRWELPDAPPRISAPPERPLPPT